MRRLAFPDLTTNAAIATLLCYYNFIVVDNTGIIIIHPSRYRYRRDRLRDSTTVLPEPHNGDPNEKELPADGARRSIRNRARDLRCERAVLSLGDAPSRR